jgi:hypothetical protein
MEPTAAQTSHLEARTADILARISRVLPDWSAERLRTQAAAMALLEMRCEAKSVL